jgi:dienelactone hydrolase
MQRIATRATFHRAACSLAFFLTAINAAHAQEKVFFPSADFANIYEMSRAKGKPTQVFGYLTMPSNSVTGKVPVVVIAHGSAGIEKKDREFWAPYFNKLGFAALVVDSFTPRGVTRTVDDQSLVSRAASTVDAFYALKFLASDSRFDRNKIGIIGFSRGGTAANHTATMTFRNNVLRENKDLQFAFHIPMYLNCSDTGYRKKNSFDKTGAPMLFLLGGRDDYTPAAQCNGLLKGMQAEYKNVIDYRVYEGANHSFDADNGVKYAAMAITGRNCAVVEIDLETWSKHVVASNEPLTAEKEKGFYKSCVTRGASYGAHNTKYREMATKDIEAFLRQTSFIN